MADRRKVRLKDKNTMEYIYPATLASVTYMEDGVTKVGDVIEELKNSNVINEINNARGSYSTLNDRLNGINSQLEDKVNESDLEVERKRIDNLVKVDSRQTEGNAELIDIRFGVNGEEYNTAGEHVRNIHKTVQKINSNLNEFFTIHKTEDVTDTFPLTGYTNENGWLHKNLNLKDRKWKDFKGVYIAFELECIKLDNVFTTNSVTVTAKYKPHISIASLTRVSENVTLTQGNKYIIEYFGTMPELVNEYPEANMLMIQFGNQSTIGNPILKINNFFMANCIETELNNIRSNFFTYGFNEKYIKTLDYNDILPNTRPKINGIELTPETKFNEFNQEIKAIVDENMNSIEAYLYSNKAKRFDMSTINMGIFSGMTLDKTVNEDGSVTFEIANVNNGSGWAYTTNILLPDFKWIAGHKYLIALKGRFNRIENDVQGSAAGNFSISVLQPAKNAMQTTAIGTSELKTKIGTIGAITNFMSLNTIDGTKLEQAVNKNAITMQLEQINNGALINITLFDICVLDATELGLNDYEIVDRFNQYEYLKDDIEDSKFDIYVTKSENSNYAKKAGSIDNLNISADIEIWGDSLVAQGYGKYIGEILGRNVLTKGYGGKTSTYIRDKFLSEANVNKVQIINVGRNNYKEVDVIIQDIREMVATIPHNNFLICCPPNGNYGEGVGTNEYEKFRTIEERLRKQYQSNFLNTREATIQEYDMGNVKLLENFIQPQIGGQVTIKVSNAEFLVTYNTYDVDKWGEELMRKVAIGMYMNKLDIYNVDSYDLINNTLTITLVENNSGVTPGSSVGNKIDDGGLNSLKYVKVLQNGDYYCWKIDTTQSTFRKDGIHMSDVGLRCQAKVVARKINTMKI